MTSKEKRDQFRNKVLTLVPFITEKHSNEIFDYAFEMIKEGLVNSAINCTLDGDMNAIDLDTLLDEANWEDEGAVQKQRIERNAGTFLCDMEDEGISLYQQYENLVKHSENGGGRDLASCVEGVMVWEQVDGICVDDLLGQID